MYKQLSYSEITKSAAKILTPWINTKTSLWYKTYGGFHTGLDIEAAEVFSFTAGVVLHIGEDEKYKTVTVQFDVNNSFVYSHLKSVSVKQGDILKQGDRIGTADRHVHFEYISLEENTNPAWIVRVGTVTYYKHNPELVLNGAVKLDAGNGSLIEQNQGCEDLNFGLTPYVITADKTSPVLDMNVLRSKGVVGVMIDAGGYYDQIHLPRAEVRNPKLHEQVQNAVSAGLLFGLFTDVMARNLNEVTNEVKALDLIIRRYPPSLGLWLRTHFTTAKKLNDDMLNKYRESFERMGLKRKLGFYIDKSQLKMFDWEKQSDNWYLWLNSHVNNVSEFEQLLTPEFFTVP